MVTATGEAERNVAVDLASGDDRTAISIEFPGPRTVSVSIEPTTEKDFEHLRKARYRWMRLRCVETGVRANQLISRDIPLESVIFYARRVADAKPRTG